MKKWALVASQSSAREEGSSPEKKGELNASLILLRERGRKSGQRGDGEQGPT